MKKVFLTVIFAVIAAVCTHAQLFIGGSLGIDFGASSSTSGSSSTTNKAPSSFRIGFNPMAGYSMSDRFSAGLRAGISVGIQNDRKETPKKDYTYEWLINPFIRNTMVSGEKLSLLLESNVSVSGLMVKTSEGSVVTDKDRVFSFGIRVLPVLQYSLTNKLNLEARSNFLSLGFVRTSSKENPTADAGKTTQNSFGLGVNSGSSNMNIPFEIGMTYKF